MPDTIDIERILDKRKEGRRVQYFIKWKNYDDSENTWENRTDLIQDGHAKQIRHYELQMKTAAAGTATTAPRATTTKTGGAARRVRSRSPAPRRRAPRSSAAPRSTRKKTTAADPGTPPPPAPKAAPKNAMPTSSPAAPPASPVPTFVPTSRLSVRGLGQLLLLCSVAFIGDASEHIDVRGRLASTGLIPAVLIPPLWLMQPLALFTVLLAMLTHPSLFHDPFAKWVTVGLVWRVAGEFVLGASGAALGEDLGLAAGSAEAIEEAFVCAIFCFLVAHAAFAVANAPAKNDTRLALLACLAMLGADGIVALAPDHQRIDRQRLRYRALLGGLSAVGYCFLALTSPHA